MILTKRNFLYSITVLFIVLVISAIIIPDLSQPRIPWNHRRAVKTIQYLNLAEHNYVLRHKNAGYACNLSDLVVPNPVSDVDLRVRLLVSGTDSSGTQPSGTLAYYHFEIQCTKNGSNKAIGYTITALPVIPGVVGVFAICSDQSGEIWYSENGLATECFALRIPVEQKYR